MEVPLMSSSFHTVQWSRGAVVLLDQRLLPARERYVRCRDAEAVARAIESMVVRGAPAIGVTAALGLALGARRLAAQRLRPTRQRRPAEGDDAAAFRRGFERLCRRFAATRPTAVNLFWAIERMRRVAEEALRDGLAGAVRRLEHEALAIQREDVEANRRIGRHGAGLVPRRATILTHCNAGALATAGYGTALGVVRAAREAGKRVEVLADETRPFLQGARLTAWELQKDRIPVRLITDNMAGHFLRRGNVDMIVVGADRIASNGDVANKIGTYSVAVLARENGVPFYVAAPLSTLDPRARSGADIPIEERSPAEVTSLAGRRIAPRGVKAEHPAFDVTPARLVTAIITEAGVARPPYRSSLAALLHKGRAQARAAARTARAR
jgi:methylthioribose-1-phosphate isomerase